MSAIHKLMLEVERQVARLTATAPDKVKVSGKPLPPELIEKLCAHKAALFSLLMRNAKPEASWSVQDWHDCFEERAAILECDAGLSRPEAEHVASSNYGLKADLVVSLVQSHNAAFRQGKTI